MKNNLLAAILLLPGLFFAQTENSFKKVSLNDSGIGYQFPECMRAGSVCNLFPKDSTANEDKVMAFKISANSFGIEIKNSFLTDEKQIAILGKLIRSFTKNEPVLTFIDTDYPMPIELLRALDINLALNTIKAGSYPVVISENHIVLKFELVSK
ncbi:MAG: hypothetical protein ACOVLC_04190 [Flavobacterium sp.]